MADRIDANRTEEFGEFNVSTDGFAGDGVRFLCRKVVSERGEVIQLLEKLKLRVMQLDF